VGGIVIDIDRFHLTGLTVLVDPLFRIACIIGLVDIVFPCNRVDLGFID